MPKQRVAYLCLETPREGQATYTHVHEIIDGLTALDWDIELFATRGGGSASGSSYWQRALGYIAVQWRLLRQLSRFDAVYMRAHFAALPASLWAWSCKKCVVQEINGQPADIFVTYSWLRRFGLLVKLSYRWQMTLAGHVIVVTEGLRGWARSESGHGRISLVANGANTRVFTPDGPRPDGDWPYIAFVGGLTAWHGIDVMTKATRRCEWPSDVRLVIIGDGKERARVTEELAAAGDRIVWLGRLPQDQVAQWLRGAIGALSVTQDTQGHLGTGVAPLKLFEAMASGVPVIVTDLPFQADLVRAERAGVVIPMADPAALARAVAVLAGDPDASRDQGLRGAAYVRAHASWQARAVETADILRKAMEEVRSRARAP